MSSLFGGGWGTGCPRPTSKGRRRGWGGERQGRGHVTGVPPVGGRGSPALSQSFSWYGKGRWETSEVPSGFRQGHRDFPDPWASDFKSTTQWFDRTGDSETWLGEWGSPWTSTRSCGSRQTHPPDGRGVLDRVLPKLISFVGWSFVGSLWISGGHRRGFTGEGRGAGLSDGTGAVPGGPHDRKDLSSKVSTPSPDEPCPSESVFRPEGRRCRGVWGRPRSAPTWAEGWGRKHARTTSAAQKALRLDDTPQTSRARRVALDERTLPPAASGGPRGPGGLRNPRPRHAALGVARPVLLRVNPCFPGAQEFY